MGRSILDDNPNGTDSIFWFHGYNAISDQYLNIGFDYIKLLDDIKKHASSNIPLIFDARNNYILTNLFTPKIKIDGEDIEINGYLSERIGAVSFTNENIEVDVDVPSTGVSITSFSDIYFYVKFQFSDLLGTKDAKKYAITIYTNEYNHYLSLLKYIGLKLNNLGETIIANKILLAMNMAKSNNDSFALNWLYEKAPQSVIKSRNDKLLYEDLYLLLKYEKNKIFNGGSGIVKNLLGFKDLSFVYIQFVGFPELVIQLYNEMNKENRRQFCEILKSLTLLFDETQLIRQKFYVGDKYEFIAHPKPVSNNFYGSIPSDYLNQITPASPYSKVFLYNDVAYKSTGGAVSASSVGAAKQSSKDDAKNKPKQTKYEFHPLELVELYYEDVPKSVTMPAIYAKYIADEKERDEALNSLFIAINIISILMAGGLLLNGAKGLARLFALADIVTATVDNFVRTLSEKDKQELSKMPEGKWFLDNWDTINAIVGVGMLTTTLAKGISENGPKIIEWFEKRQMGDLADELRKLYYKADELMKDAGKLAEEVDEARLTALQKKLLPGIIKRYYNSYKTLLAKLEKEADIMKEWNKLKAMRDLDADTMKMMKEWRDFYFPEDAYNVAIMKQRVKVNDKIIELEYKAFAGDGINAEGFCKNPDLGYIARQLKMTEDELLANFITLEKKGAMRRFYDSEHKIFAQNDLDLQVLYAKYGEQNVQIIEQNIKTVFEPCLSCKKQIVIRQQLYNIQYISVEATRLDKLGYVKNDKQFLEIFK